MRKKVRGNKEKQGRGIKKKERRASERGQKMPNRSKSKINKIR